MDFSYTAYGTIDLYGCATPIIITKYYPHSFNEGSTVYIRSKALGGKLEFVCIKRVNRVFPSSPSCAGIKPVFNYIDTFNRLWLEEELVWQSEAISLATAYWEGVKAEVEALIATSCIDATVPKSCK